MSNNDYIKRSDIVEAMCEQCEARCFSVNDNNCLEYHVLNHIPAADVEPVRHGYWVERGNDRNPYCSECYGIGNQSPFCPHCGAKMDAKPPEE